LRPSRRRLCLLSAMACFRRRSGWNDHRLAENR
jgi:hypothetical protein